MGGHDNRQMSKKHIGPESDFPFGSTGSSLYGIATHTANQARDGSLGWCNAQLELDAQATAFSYALRAF